MIFIRDIVDRYREIDPALNVMYIGYRLAGKIAAGDVECAAFPRHQSQQIDVGGLRFGFANDSRSNLRTLFGFGSGLLGETGRARHMDQGKGRRNALKGSHGQ